MLFLQLLRLGAYVFFAGPGRAGEDAVPGSSTDRMVKKRRSAHPLDPSPLPADVSQQAADTSTEEATRSSPVAPCLCYFGSSQERSGAGLGRSSLGWRRLGIAFSLSADDACLFFIVVSWQVSGTGTSPKQSAEVCRRSAQSTCLHVGFVRDAGKALKGEAAPTSSEGLGAV